MTRVVPLLLLSIAIASCGKSSGPDGAAAATDAPKTAAVVAGANPCTLVDDPNALFGQSVNAEVATMPNGTKTCEWKLSDGRMCGSVGVYGEGWNEVPDVPANYSAMVSSLGAFGKTQPVAGLGEEATIVDGGMLGTQLAIRTGKALVHVGASCGGSATANQERAEHIARSAIGKL